MGISAADGGYLNTSNVTVNHYVELKNTTMPSNLNTSNVTVNQSTLYKLFIINYHLNTSNVTVNPYLSVAKQIDKSI